MKFLFSAFPLFPALAGLLFLSPASPGRKGGPGAAEPLGLLANPLPARSKALFRDWKKGPGLLAEKGWFVWGGSVLRGEDGRWHMFYSRWPKRIGFFVGT